MSELFNFDNAFNLNIIGTDEAGRGPGAGDVFAAAVFFPASVDKHLFKNLNDSKKLTAKKREELYAIIKENAVYSIISSSVEEINSLNILRASLLAMKRACEEVVSKIGTEKIKILVDGNKLIKDFNYPQQCVIKGDAKSASIAAASILAKVERDRYMLELAQKYPMYDWENNKGYLTPKHIDGIKKYGLTPYHRKKFVENIVLPSEQLAFF